MTTAAMVPKSTRLAKTDSGVRTLALKLERAIQTRNERVARADADYAQAVRRAVADLDPDDNELKPTDATPDAVPVAQ